jgi:hypothetical protein
MVAADPAPAPICYNGRAFAEVVELADTPSKSPKSSVFSKFRVINQVANKSDTCPPYLINCSCPKTTQGCGDRIQKRTRFTLQNPQD